MNLSLLTKTINPSKRTLSISNTWLGAVATVSAAVVYILIIYGSHVRVTDSGMGCPDWPLCKGSIGPFQGFHAFMEQTHRYLAGIVSVLVILTWYLASRLRTRLAAIKPAIFTVAIVVVQVILGAITVFDSNGAPTVAAHLLAGLALLGGATVTAVATLVEKRESTEPRLGSLAWSAIGSAGLLYLSGSLVVNAEAEKACASFPFCPSSQPLHLVLLHLLHRTVALFAVIALVAFAMHAWRDWAKIPGARTLAATIIGLLVATATLGIFSALRKAPADLQDLHLAGAAAVLAVSVALATLGWLTGADRNASEGFSR